MPVSEVPRPSFTELTLHICSSSSGPLRPVAVSPGHRSSVASISRLLGFAAVSSTTTSSHFVMSSPTFGNGLCAGTSNSQSISRSYSGYTDSQKPLYFEQGEDQDAPFDVRADFDGQGPRWSDVYGTGTDKGDERR